MVKGAAHEDTLPGLRLVVEGALQIYEATDDSDITTPEDIDEDAVGPLPDGPMLARILTGDPMLGML